MIAKIFPQDATKRAVNFDIPFSSARRNATSELNGNTVAAKKAQKKSATSSMGKLLLKSLNILYS